MRVKDLMSRRVFTVAPEATVDEAARVMSDNQIGCLVVAEKEGIAGILTERDLLNRIVIPGKNSRKMRVEQVMTAPVQTIGPEASVDEVADLMSTHKFRRLPVVQGGRLVGIVTSTDVVRVYLDVDKVVRDIALKETARAPPKKG
ncbi:MAG: CBS domain-containing protein [Euryarchaeota archaeon]|nr:CBS domain-containing protein [Euryarchaeota archaeon]